MMAMRTFLDHRGICCYHCEYEKQCFKKDETMKETVVVSTSEFDEWSPVVLTRENIVDVLMKRLETKITLDSDKLFVQEQLQELR